LRETFAQLLAVPVKVICLAADTSVMTGPWRPYRAFRWGVVSANGVPVRYQRCCEGGVSAVFGDAAGVTAELASAATLAFRFTTMGSVWTHFAFHMRRGVAEYRQTSRRNVSACGISGET